MFNPGLPDFVFCKRPKLENVYQMTKKCDLYQMAIASTKWLYGNPKGHKIYQHFPFQVHPKYIDLNWNFSRILSRAIIVLADVGFRFYTLGLGFCGLEKFTK
jgi:hypothetical protein